MSEEEDALAAAWGAELEGEPVIAAEPARVLNQAEIDSLLGFDGGAAAEDSRSGIHRIISSGLVS